MRRTLTKTGLSLIGFAVILAVLLYALVWMYELTMASEVLDAGLVYGVLPICALGVILILVGLFTKD